MQLQLLGYACGTAAGDPGCADGPPALWQQDLAAQLTRLGLPAQALPLFFPQEASDKYQQIAELCTRLSKITENLQRQSQSFALLAGDHSCAIGTWSGVAHALRSQGNIGLIWIDAHLDSHTPDTSPSGNIHGMPLAALLGEGDPRLTKIADHLPKLKPENVCVIGARSYEPGEKALLEKLKVRIFYMDEILQRGLPAVMGEAKHIVTQSTVGFGVSLDLDSLDPREAPAVGTPETGGLHVDALCQTISSLISHDPHFLGAEITEYNPHHDVEGKTVKVVLQLLMTLFGEKAHASSHA